MSFIERVRARAAARELLGVGKQADPGEIRAAWRRAAFEAHPDRNQGDEGGFARVRAAYDLLSHEDAPEELWAAFSLATRPNPASCEPCGPSKPKIVTRIRPLPPEVIATCRALLAAEADEAPPVGAGEAAAPYPDAGASPARRRTADHVPAAVAVRGRELSFHIPSQLVRGLNRIALPTAVLQDKAMTKPRVVRFRSPASGPGEIDAPDRIRERFFPGARSVRFRFRGS